MPQASVVHPKWPGERAVQYTSSESVGTVADRVADQQGLDGRYTLQGSAGPLDRSKPMPTAADGATLALVGVSAS